MLAFLDFETAGLDGEILEACAVDVTGNVLEEFSSNQKEEDFLQFIDKVLEKSEVIIFWHNFMPLYLQTFQPEVLSKLFGKFFVFADFYAIFDGVKQPRYKIDDITRILTGRNHKGNAKDDALDLCECFVRMQ